MKYILFSLLFLLHFYSKAQHTQAYTSIDAQLQNGIQLLDNQLFKAAKTQFQSYLKLPLNAEQIKQGEYYSLLASLYLGEENLENSMENFVNRYPNSLETANLHQKTADYYFNKSDYENAIKFYELAKISNPQTEDDYKAIFNLGYSYFILERREAAKLNFDKIKSTNHTYTYPANYYSGFIAYLQNNDSEAIIDLEKAANDNNYKPEVDNLIPLIEYRRKQYEQVIAHCISLQDKGNTLNNKQLLVLGDSYYHKKEYLEAVKYLDRYAESQNKIERNIAYRLAYSLSEIGDNYKAQPYFAIVAEENDSLAQNAAYNLGISYLATHKKELAVNAFDKARKMEHDRKIQEQAAFKYVNLCFDLRDYNKTIQGCEFFEKSFPNSSELDEVSNLLTESYLNSGNYAQALNYIEKIPNKSKKIQANYQRLAYNQAVEMFNKDSYTQAEIMLKKSLKFPINKDLANTSNYYLGEIYSYDEKYDSALIYYNRLTENTTDYNEAFYGKGYAAYNKKDYKNATNYFQNYIKLTSNSRNKADAEIRLADCYYIEKDYENASKLYDKALQNKNVDSEYLYYQKGMILANQDKFDESLLYFDKLIVEFPNSKYYETALYRKGLLNFDLNQKPIAIDNFTQLIRTRPQSELVPNALSKRAICYQLLNNQQDAVNDFRQIVSNYPTHEVAEDAVQGLQELYEKGYEITDYQALMDKFGRANPNSKAALEGEFVAAKSHYDNGNYVKAINGLQWFVKKYPDNELTFDAYYFLGASYDQNNGQNGQTGDVENALFAFSKVKGNYEVRALQRAGEIEFQRQNYTNANSKYESMIKNTLNKRYEGNALAGMMQCNFYLKNYDKVQDLANQLYNKNHTKFWSLADLYLGKIMVEKSDFNAAILQLQKTVNANQDINGAEAQYLIGVVLRKQKKYEESTKALIEVRNKFNNYSLWVYEAFLLIAENYVDLQNKFQAKATLQSIIEVSTDEKIKEKARKRLAEIAE
jgi:tetratricopeptide (TPR) repeat protein